MLTWISQYARIQLASLVFCFINCLVVYPCQHDHNMLMIKHHAVLQAIQNKNILRGFWQICTNGNFPLYHIYIQPRSPEGSYACPSLTIPYVFHIAVGSTICSTYQCREPGCIVWLYYAGCFVFFFKWADTLSRKKLSGYQSNTVYTCKLVASIATCTSTIYHANRLPT